MKQRLHTTLGQQLTMTPRMQQALHLLQLPSVELAAELTEAVAGNPLLEWAEDGQADTEAESDPATVDLPVLTAAVTATGARPDQEPGDGAVELRAIEPDLRHSLQSQVDLLRLSPADRAIACALVDAIDDDGYLRTPLEEIAVHVMPQRPPAVEAVLAVLRLVQSLDPPGVAARDLGECLRLQLLALPETTAWRGLAIALTAPDVLQQLPRQDLPRLSRQLGVTQEDLHSAIALLRAQSPRPGNTHALQSDDPGVLPDLVIWRQQQHWQVRLGPHAGPPVTISQHYSQLIGQCSTADAGYLREQLQQAQWLIKGLQARGKTLLRIGQALLQHQTGFLLHGQAALRPLTLRQLADELGLHESTLSRAIAGKFVQTPRGTVPLRLFFSQAVNAADGEDHAGTAIQAVIRQLVDQEDPRKPLSDARLVQQLKERGMTVARRTVAKYREAMSIPPSHARVRMG